MQKYAMRIYAFLSEVLVGSNVRDVRDQQTFTRIGFHSDAARQSLRGEGSLEWPTAFQQSEYKVEGYLTMSSAMSLARNSPA